MNDSSPRKYAVFISYRHADNKEPGQQWAAWLHHSLETYEVPPDLVGTPNLRGQPVPASLYPVFRDEEELPADADLSANIRNALENSVLLVVLCSPQAVASRFVADEIRYFKELGRTDRILALMIDGEPNASDDPAKQLAGLSANLECFPETLRFGVARPDGSVDWAARTEPIAADVRPEGKPGQGFTTPAAYQEALAGRGDVLAGEVKQRAQDYEGRLELAKLKVIAGALGVPLGQLTQRDKAYQLEKERKRALTLRRWLAAVGVLAALAISGGALAWLQKKEAESQRRQVAISFSRSDFIQGTTLLDKGKASEGLAYLARAIRTDANNLSAAARLYSALVYREFCRQISGPMKHEGDVTSAQYSPDGRWVVTASDDHSARVWEAATGKSVSEPMKHEGEVTSAHFSPDGRWVVTASRDGSARVWESATGKPISEPMRHTADVASAQFSPDGRWVVTASGSVVMESGISMLKGEARVWEAATGKPVSEPMKHEYGVHSAQFSPDGRWVVTASGSGVEVSGDVSDSLDGEARVWEAATGKPVSEPMKQKRRVSSAQFSPDGRWVVTASLGFVSKGEARVWTAATGKPVSQPMLHEYGVNCAQFSPDGRWVVTASDDHSAQVWEAATGKPVSEPMKHEYEVKSAQFSPDGRWVVTASGDQSACVWEAATGKPVSEPMKHAYGVNSAQFSPDGRWVVTASGGSAQVWEVAAGKPVSEPMKHKEQVTSAQFSPDGHWVVTASVNYVAESARFLRKDEARVWEVATGKPVSEPIKHEYEVHSAQFSPDGRWVVTASGSGAEVSGDDSPTNEAQVWEAATGKPVSEPMKHKGEVRSAQFSPDGRWVVTASGSGAEVSGDDSATNEAQVWEAATGKPVSEPIKHEDWVNSAQFSPDGRWVVTASGSDFSKGEARVWEAATGKPVSELMKHRGRVNSAQFSPDGRWVVTASGDKNAQVWEAATGHPVSQPMKHTEEVKSAQFSPDGRWVVTTSGSLLSRVSRGELRVWERSTGKPVSEPMEHEYEVKSAQFSPDGRWVVTASGRSTRVWEVATGKPVSEPMKHADGVSSVQFSPDGRWVVTAASDGTTRMWEVCPPEVQEMTHTLAAAGEWVAQMRLNELGGLEWRSTVSLKVQIAYWQTNAMSAPARQFVDWLTAPRATRHSSPFGRVQN